MLVELKVSNFAIIDSIEMSFERGFNVLSGETGAGKSILLKSLALLMGEKAMSDTVRTGAETASIEGCFDLTTRPDIQESLLGLGIEAVDEILVVRRVISSQGRSRIYMNGILSALTNLREVVAPMIEVAGNHAPLIEMTGQHDNRHLQSKAYHLDVLDFYTGSMKKRHEYSRLYSEKLELTRQLEEMRKDTRLREQRLDYLKYQQEEIRGLGLEPGDETKLEERVALQKNSSKLIDFAQQTENVLYSDEDSALVRLHRVIQNAQELSKIDSKLPKKMESLVQAKDLIEDCIYEIRDYGQGFNVDANELNDIEDKLSDLRRIQKKYGPSLVEIFEELEEIESEIEKLESSDEVTQTLEKQISQIELTMKSLGEDLHQRRAKGADLLAKSVNEELRDLNMKGLTFKVEIALRETAGATGISDVEFVIRQGSKDSYRPIAKVASGGELSRLLLALKCVVGHSDQPRTYLFDEVDTGVSGETAEKVGRKLKSIAKAQQVICVTHLPQVAAFADHHFFINKTTTKQRVRMQIQTLTQDERVKEVARLISGEKITKTSLDHARSLVQSLNS